MYTEAEAKTKWCPHAVASHTDPRRGFRKEDGGEWPVEPNHPCIASMCMAWRWVNKAGYTINIDGVEQAIPQRGHCGLSGKP